MQMIRRTVLAAFAVLALGSVAVAAEPIRVGAILSTTGPAASLGEAEQKALTLEVDRINAAGGLKGRPLALVVYDDGSDAAKANGLAKRLIESDRAEILIGGTTTGATMAIAPGAEKAGLPFISLAGGIVIVDPVKKWVFKTPHTDRMAVAKVFADLRKRGLTKLALLTDTSGFGQSGRKEAQALAGSSGIEIVVDETYGPKDTDVTAQLTKIRAAAPQALFVFGFGQGAAVVTKNVVQLGIAVPHYQSHGVASKEYLELSGPAGEGVRMPTPALTIWDRLADADPQKPVVTDLVGRWRARYGEDPSTFGGYAFDALRIWAAAVERAGSTDPVKVRDEIEATRGYVGTSGIVTMSPTDHMGLDTDAFRLVAVEKGRFVPVD
jgi:branched-chain amino acid transport system substrate-binding protein